MTELEDGILNQTIDVLPVIRRSLSLAETTGLFWCYMQNVHGAADDEASVQDPYAPVGAIPPYPSIVPNDFDFYLLSAGVIRSAGAGGLTGAAVQLDPIAAQQGWGVDDTGGALVINSRQTVAFWDNIVTVAGIDFGENAASGTTTIRVAQRIRRGTTIDFITTSAAAATFQLVMLCALMPVATGQDCLY